MGRFLLFSVIIAIFTTQAATGYAIETFSEPAESGSSPSQGMAVRPVSTNYTFSAADSGQFIDFSSAGMITAIIEDESEPDVSGTHYPEGTVLTWGMRGGGTGAVSDPLRYPVFEGAYGNPAACWDVGGKMFTKKGMNSEFLSKLSLTKGGMDFTFAITGVTAGSEKGQVIISTQNSSAANGIAFNRSYKETFRARHFGGHPSTQDVDSAIYTAGIPYFAVLSHNARTGFTRIYVNGVLTESYQQYTGSADSYASAVFHAGDHLIGTAALQENFKLCSIMLLNKFISGAEERNLRALHEREQNILYTPSRADLKNDGFPSEQP